jgi:hypothetical protein
MAKGNSILVTQNYDNESLIEGIIASGETPKPGTIVQKQSATALQGGRHTVEIYNADADGANPKGPYYLLVEDKYQGRTVSDAYAAGERCFMVVPRHGDEYNLLILNLAGTGDDHTKGEILIIDDTTGKFIATAGSPEDEVAQLLETITDPTADTLAWCVWQGKG